MKRVGIPVFSGEKTKYETWKAAFEACIDKAPATPEYTLLQLRQYMKGDALQAIDDLGHSAEAYTAAKERLERKFGGEKRKLIRFLDDLDRFPNLKSEDAKTIEKFADLLDVAVMNLKQTDHGEELGKGSLYLKLQRKMPEKMLTRFNRWLFETGEDEGVETLKNWINQESELQQWKQNMDSNIMVNAKNPQVTEPTLQKIKQFVKFAKIGHTVSGNVRLLRL